MFHSKTPVLESDFNKFFPVKFAKFLRTSILKTICERLLLYFQYNFHHHFHYHHFCYHCKMQLCRIIILLTIPLDCNMIPCPAYIFLYSYSKLFFVFHARLKDSEFVYDLQKNFRCSLYTYLKPVEMKKILGGLPIMKYCRPPWLADKENFSFQIV